MKIKEDTRVWLCPTDTIYGFSARVSDGVAVERIKIIKGGREGMHFIILIADIEQLQKIGITINQRQKDFLQKIWPGPVSVIFEQDKQVSQESPSSLAVRLPNHPELRALIREIGPIISTSANRHGEAPIKTVVQAKEIFGDEVDEYIDGGRLSGAESTLVKILR